MKVIILKNHCSKEPQDGQDIQLTIDSSFSEYLWGNEGEKGSSVALIQGLGGSALVNSPSYDPNQFILGMSNEQWKQLNEDKDQPLLIDLVLPMPPVPFLNL